MRVKERVKEVFIDIDDHVYMCSVKPRIERDSVPKITKLKVGQSFTLSVKFRGEPAPTPVWTVKDKVLCPHHVIYTFALQ